MNINLYINGLRAELREDPHIEFTWQTTDYTEPTAVKNSFSKTITLPRTPDNDRIFNHMSDLRRMQMGGFNPSRRCPFTLDRDGVLVEKGYVKLDNITNTDYQITLYGGLSQFLFSLTYDLDGNKRTLSGLNFKSDLSFRISKDTVREAWDSLRDGTDDKWQDINFAVCYEGVPDDFSADKVMVNVNGADYQVRQALPDGVATQTIASAVTDDGVEYKATDGYLMGDLRRERTGLEVRDLRSYLQRPVIRTKALINAICDPVNNGGYEVDLDPLFFRSGNPYWERTWITLPLLTGLDLDSSSEEYSWALGDSTTVNTYDTTWVIKDDSVLSSTPTSYTLGLNLSTTVSGSSSDGLYLSSDDSLGGIAIQVYGVDTSGEAVCGSRVMLLTNRSGNGAVYDIQRAVADNAFTPAYQSSVETVQGYYQRKSGNTFVWSSPLTLGIDTSSAPVEMRIRLVYLPYLSNGVWTSGPKRKWTYPSISDDSTHYVSTASITDRTGTAYYDGETGVHSNTFISKDTLLSGLDGTPADWLLSITKTFGLYMVKDRLHDRISIMTRSTYFNGGDRQFDRRIDRSRETRIDPITFSVKTFTMGDSSNDRTSVEEAYYNTYGKPYGSQTIDTGYDFDRTSQELNKDSRLNNAAMILEKSNWFTSISYDNQQIPSVFHDWVTLRYTSDEDDIEVNTGYPSGADFNYLNPSYTTYYDLFPKAQHHTKDNSHTERSGVMLFLNGMEDTSSMGLWLTDDTPLMMSLNDGEPCWLITASSTDKRGDTIALSLDTIPSFSRYSVNTGEITDSLDFGRNRELYIPDISYSTGDVTVYEHYWADYMRDLYSVDTRRYECHIDHNGEDVNPDWLRNFYYFDNSLWVMNKIDSYDITSQDPVKCEFTKVMDRKAYTGVTQYEDYVFTVERGDKNGVIASDGSIKATVYLWSDMAWTSTVREDFATLSPSSGSSSSSRQTLTLTFQTNTTDERRTATCIFRRADGRARLLRVTQAASGETTEYIQITPQSVEIPMDAGDWSATVTVTSSSDWTILQPSSMKWMTVTPDSGQAGETTVTVTSQDNNTGLERRSNVMFKNSTGNSVMFKGTQSAERGDYITLTPEYLNLPWSGSQPDRVTVKASGDWSVETYPDWVTYTKESLYLEVTAEDNGTTSSRSGKVTVKCGNATADLTVYQDAKPSEPTKTLEAIPSSLSFKAADTEAREVTVVSTDDWNIYSSPGWVSTTKTTTGFTATAAENTAHSSRTGYVVLTSGALSATVTITQEAAAYTKTPLAWGTYSTTGTTAPVKVNNTDITPEVDGDEWRVEYEGEITSTRYMFTGATGTRAYKTVSIDPSLDTSKITDMRGMFKGCKDLETMDMSGWNTEACKEFTSMFDGCTGLKSLRLSGWDVAAESVQINYFLYGCSSLETVDLSGWAISPTASMTQFFYGCSSLTTIYVTGCSTETTDLLLNQLNTYLGSYTWTLTDGVITRS